MSVFKKYEAGEPTCRLYVKNIAKQVEEKVGPFYLSGSQSLSDQWDLLPPYFARRNAEVEFQNVSSRT